MEEKKLSFSEVWSRDRTTRSRPLIFVAFFWAAIGFLIVTLIGIFTYLYISSEGILTGIATNDDYFSVYNQLSVDGANEAALRLVYISFAAIAFIILSSVFQIIWAFRVFKASKTFIYSVWTIYVIGQGLSFGILFSTWNAIELLAIFGLSSVIFFSLGTIGHLLYKRNYNLASWGRVLFYTSIVAISLIILNVVLYYVTNIYSNQLSFIINTIFGFLIIGYTIFDIWSLSKFSNENSVFLNDEKMRFRIISWFSFRLLVDFIAIIWYIARIYLRFK